MWPSFLKLRKPPSSPWQQWSIESLIQTFRRLWTTTDLGPPRLSDWDDEGASGYVVGTPANREGVVSLLFCLVSDIVDTDLLFLVRQFGHRMSIGRNHSDGKKSLSCIKTVIVSVTFNLNLTIFPAVQLHPFAIRTPMNRGTTKTQARYILPDYRGLGTSWASQRCLGEHQPQKLLTNIWIKLWAMVHIIKI